MLSVFTAADVTKEAVERTAAVGVDRIIIQKPGIALPGFVKEAFNVFF